MTNLLGNHLPYSLWATIHISVQIHMKVVLPPRGSYGYLNQRPIRDNCLSSAFIAPFWESPSYKQPKRVDMSIQNNILLDFKK